jgi:hypothetical protein
MAMQYNFNFKVKVKLWFVIKVDFRQNCFKQYFVKVAAIINLLFIDLRYYKGR